MFDSVGSRRRVVVFPYAKYGPSRIEQHGVHFLIATNIALNLRDPILDVAARLSVMERTAMPEATVYEHRHLRSCENDIGGATNARHWARRDTVPPAAPMQDGPQRQLWPRIPAAVSLHDLPDGRGAGSDSHASI